MREEREKAFFCFKNPSKTTTRRARTRQHPLFPFLFFKPCPPAASCVGAASGPWSGPSPPPQTRAAAGGRRQQRRAGPGGLAPAGGGQGGLAPAGGGQGGRRPRPAAGRGPGGRAGRGRRHRGRRPGRPGPRRAGPARARPGTLRRGRRRRWRRAPPGAGRQRRGGAGAAGTRAGRRRRPGQARGGTPPESRGAVWPWGWGGWVFWWWRCPGERGGAGARNASRFPLSSLSASFPLSLCPSSLTATVGGCTWSGRSNGRWGGCWMKPVVEREGVRVVRDKDDGGRRGGRRETGAHAHHTAAFGRRPGAGQASLASRRAIQANGAACRGARARPRTPTAASPAPIARPPRTPALSLSLSPPPPAHLTQSRARRCAWSPHRCAPGPCRTGRT